MTFARTLRKLNTRPAIAPAPAVNRPTVQRFTRSLRVFGPRVNMTPPPVARETIGLDELVAMADTDKPVSRVRPYIRNQRARITNYLTAACTSYPTSVAPDRFAH
jgi:hypothetical protein